LSICLESHKEGLAKQTWSEPNDRVTQIEVVDEIVNKYKQIKLPMKLGDFLFFDPYFIHRSGHNLTEDEIRFSLVTMWNDCSHKDWKTPKPNFVQRTISCKENFDKLMTDM
tara:strand:+ start:647 stop:979 length:333 start_codon:yes stop_codon:yes gene_type:complete